MYSLLFYNYALNFNTSSVLYEISIRTRDEVHALAAVKHFSRPTFDIMPGIRYER